MPNAKQKGNRGELEMAKILNERFGEGKKVFSRVPSSGAWGGGQNREKRENMSLEQRITLVSDIMTPPKFKYVIEHKFYKEPNFWELFNESSNIKQWFIQVSGDAAFVGKEPLLVVKYNNKKRIVFSRDRLDGYVFETDGWFCYWLEDFLKNDNSFFFV